MWIGGWVTINVSRIESGNTLHISGVQECCVVPLGSQWVRTFGLELDNMA
jgi:hypothetical protein